MLPIGGSCLYRYRAVRHERRAILTVHSACKPGHIGPPPFSVQVVKVDARPPTAILGMSGQAVADPRAGVRVAAMERGSRRWAVRPGHGVYAACGTASTARQGGYVRRLQDLPVQGVAETVGKAVVIREQRHNGRVLGRWVAGIPAIMVLLVVAGWSAGRVGNRGRDADPPSRRTRRAGLKT